MLKPFRIIIAAALIAGNCYGVTPPTVSTTCDSAKVNWTLPTARADGSVLNANELAKVSLWFSNETLPIDIPAPLTSYVYRIPSGYTTTSADFVSATATDTDGNRSAPSASVAMPVGLKCPKSLPNAPTGLGIIGVK